MTPTRQEIKAAIERTTALLEQMQFVTREPIGTTFPVAECDAAVLRAMLETFDEERALLEAAIKVYLEMDSDPFNPKFGDRLYPEFYKAAQHLVAKREKGASDASGD